MPIHRAHRAVIFAIAQLSCLQRVNITRAILSACLSAWNDASYDHDFFFTSYGHLRLRTLVYVKIYPEIQKFNRVLCRANVFNARSPENLRFSALKSSYLSAMGEDYIDHRYVISALSVGTEINDLG